MNPCHHHNKDNRRGNTGCKGGNVHSISANFSSSMKSTRNNALTSGPCFFRCNAHLAATAATRFAIVFASSSTMSIDNATFCRFCLSSNHPTRHCSAILPQLHVTLINMGKDKVPSIAICMRWNSGSLHGGQSPLKCGLTQTSQRSMNASNTHHQLSQETMYRIQMSQKHLPLSCIRKPDAKAKMKVSSAPPHRSSKEVISDVRQRHSSSRSQTQWGALHQYLKFAANSKVLFWNTVWQWSAWRGVIFSRATSCV